MVPPGVDQRVHLPSTTYEQRAVYYEDIESLLVPGFLTHTIRLGDATLSLRSPSSRDLFLVQARVRNEFNEREWMAWLLSTLVWMINGVMVLEDVNFSASLFRRLYNLPGPILSNMFTCQVSLFQRVSKALRSIEAFCYEEHSRSLWHQIGKRELSSPGVSGIPGTGSLGLNGVQRMWAAFNLVEDRRLQGLVEWQNAKFIASAHAPKGVKRLDMQDRVKFKREMVTRQEAMDMNFYRQIGLVDEDDNLADGRKLFRQAQTPDEMSDEYWRWVRGEQDDHDRVIEAYKSRIMEAYETEQSHREEQLAMLHAMPSEQVTTGPGDFPQQPIVAYDLDSLSALLKGRDPGEVRPGLKRFYSDQGADRAKGYARLQRHQAAPPEGGLSMNKDGMPVLPGGERTTKPLSLQEEIQKRVPKLGHLPGGSQ